MDARTAPPDRRPCPGRRRYLLPAAGALVLLSAAVAGCFGLRPATAPLGTLTLAENPASDCLVVLLPGRGDSARRYLEHDFAAIAAANGVDASVVAADLHMGYYRDKSAADRLHEDVVAPARARGQRVWLAGISLGGLGSLLHMANHPGEVEGAVLLSPFLGDGAILDEIEAAGSLAAWEPPEFDPDDATPPEGQEVWQRLWAFLQQTLDDPASPPLYLGVGNGDRLSRSHRLLARELPEDHVVEIAGDHDWETWTPLWDTFTSRGIPSCTPGDPAP